MTDYTETFATYNNIDLLKIIDSPDDYQLSAVKTAQTIFASRQLSDQDIQIAKAELAVFKQEKATIHQKKKELKNKIKNTGTSVLSAFATIQTETPNSDKIIKTISIVFGGLFLIQLYKECGFIGFMFTSSGAKWDFSMVLYFLPLLIVPTATILFFKRKKIGWSLLSIFLVYSAVSSVILFIKTLQRHSSGLPALDTIFPQTSPITHIVIFLFFGGALWTICKESIKEIYTVDKKYMFRTIGIVTIITALINY